MDLLKELGMIAFSARLRRLNDTITQDVMEIYKQQNLDVDLRYGPILLTLKGKEKILGSQISETLGYTKAAISQIVSNMLKENLIQETPCLEDRRKKWLSLTPKGKKLIKTLTPTWRKAEKVFHQLAEESGLDLLENLTTLENCLEEKSLAQRFFNL